jgi:hypothetical protein
MMNWAKNKMRVSTFIILLFSSFSIICSAQDEFVKKSYTVEVGSTVQKTSFKINEGDEVRISALGRVVVHGFSGTVGPDGLEGYKNYRMDPVFAYGALLYKIGDDDWNIVDPEDTIVADRSGVLKFIVNDNDPSNNSGRFSVKITVRSLKPDEPAKIVKKAEPKKTPEKIPKDLPAGTLTLSELQKATNYGLGDVKSFLTAKQFRFDDESNDKMNKYSFNNGVINATVVKDTRENQTTFITSSADNYKTIKAALDNYGYKHRKAEKKVEGVDKYSNPRYSLSIVQVTLNNKPQYFFTIKKL